MPRKISNISKVKKLKSAPSLQRPGGWPTRAPLHPFVTHAWAILTLVAFPIGLLAASRYGLSDIAAFGFGLVTSLIILGIHYVTEDSLWMFEHPWRNYFEHPEFALRLAIVAGALFFIIETALIVFFLTEPGLDEFFARVIFSRQCADPVGMFKEVCQVLVSRYGW